MRFIRITAVAAALAFAVPALASMGGSSTPEPKQPSSSEIPAGEAPTSRQQAERLYGDAYNDIAKAKKDVADKKDKNAEKRFHKALERVQEAVTLDTTYYEAWNLVGYASRKLKNYDQAVAAYQKCIGIQYDYAPAREYLGEAYLEMGKPDKAREQLATLDRLKAVNEAAELKAALELYASAHPDAEGTSATPAAAGDAANAGASASTSAPADSSQSKP